MIITFSGIDGSGKTTILNYCKKKLEDKGYNVKVLTMYDDLTFYAIIRNLRDRFIKVFTKVKVHNQLVTYSSHKIGTIDKKLAYQKIIYGFFRSIYSKRLFLIFDILIILFFFLLIKLKKNKKNIYLFDRYLYDILVDCLDYPKTKYFFRDFIIYLIPKSNISFLIETNPEKAYKRKGEFVVEYNSWRQKNYNELFRLSKLKDNVLFNDDLEIVKYEILLILKNNGL